MTPGFAGRESGCRGLFLGLRGVAAGLGAVVAILARVAVLVLLGGASVWASLWRGDRPIFKDGGRR